MSHYTRLMILTALSMSVASLPRPEVLTEQGLIRGIYLTSSRSNRRFLAFMGIPYAKPPVGELRFKEPQLPYHWEGFLNTTKEGSKCPQYNLFNGLYEGNEDCLFLNVYTVMIPGRSHTLKLPVMVYIHGGNFVAGYGDRLTSGPDFLVDENVVLVTLNYRLGVLGFLSLQNAEVPGNNGLKDQVLALKWVKRNIAAFGGNPKRITIFGDSAGAACVHYHMLSPMSNGLFDQAISQSGSSLNPWAFQTQKNSLNLALDMSKAFGELSNDTDKVLKKLRSISAHDIVSYMKKIFSKTQSYIGAIIGPTVDTNAHEGNIFLPDVPFNLLREGRFKHVPYITGINNEEAILMLRTLRDNEILLMNVIHVLNMALPYFVGHTVPNEMVQMVKAKYFSNEYNLLLQYINLLTDLYFVNAAYCSANFHAAFSNQPVYSYELSFDGSANALKRFYGAFDVHTYPGACHGDELPYLFKFDQLQVDIEDGTPEFLTSDRLVKLWSNFARYGKPTPRPDIKLQNVTWNPVSNNSFPYLNIDTNLQLKENLHNGSADWWEKLYNKFVPMATPCWHQNFLTEMNVSVKE